MSLPDVETEMHDAYRVMFVNQMHGGPRNQFIELDLVTEVSNFEPAIKSLQPNYAKNVIKRIIQSKVIIPPMDFKAMAIFFNNTIKQYEQIHGTIPSPEEIANKAGKKDLQ